MTTITVYFGDKFLDKEQRIKSYDFIENFIAASHVDWSVTANTPFIAKSFIDVVEQLPDQDLAFLTCHSGYIPEKYEPDSSQETLYSKLIEAVVMIWAKRIGFSKSELPTQKSSKEDVSISDGKNIIVCDAKAFRLGRSQGAPNVKDVLKHSDIKKWLSHHKTLNKLGGLVTFPSQHDWKKGSDFYQYTTDNSSPTLSLYYEHLSFFICSEIDSSTLINIFKKYSEVFPEKKTKNENNRSYYYTEMEKNLFKGYEQQWLDFSKVASKVVSEKAFHCKHQLDIHIALIKQTIEKEYENVEDIEFLRKKVIEAEYLNATEDLHKQTERITRFRKLSKNYL